MVSIYKFVKYTYVTIYREGRDIDKLLVTTSQLYEIH